MVKIKSQGEIKANFSAAIPRVAESYKKGVQRTTDWQEKASSEGAESRYAEGVQRAAASKLRQRQLQSVSNQEWQNRAANAGSQRIGPGMRDAVDKQSRNFEPYRQFIEGTSLPERTGDAEANVLARVVPIAKGLQDLKRGGASA